MGPYQVYNSKAISEEGEAGSASAVLPAEEGMLQCAICVITEGKILNVGIITHHHQALTHKKEPKKCTGSAEANTPLLHLQ